MGFLIQQTFWAMEKIDRKEFMEEPVFKMLFELIKSKHKTAFHTEKVLKENEETPDFCEISNHFALLPPDLFISYEVSSWLKNDRVLARIDSITIYDNEAEYLIERANGMKDLTGFVEKN